MEQTLEFQPPIEFFEKCAEEVHVLLSSSLRFSHTFRLYDAIFEQVKQPAKLVPFELNLDTEEDRATLHELLMAFRENPYVKSVMVSNPFKVAIIPFTDGIDQNARKCGAVNMILKHKIILTGINVDGEAFQLAMIEEGVQIKGKKICLIGCGGVSAAVSTTIAADCEEIALYDLDIDKSAKLHEKLTVLMPSDKVRIIDGAGRRDFSGFDIIYNGTGLGKQSKEDSDLSATPLLPTDILPDHGVAIDAVYTPERTEFLLQCEQSGMKAVNGLNHMLACTSIHLSRTAGIDLTFAEIRAVHRSLFESK